jgi:hypothetical protein
MAGAKFAAFHHDHELAPVVDEVACSFLADAARHH